jgi:hydroxyacylglutathione hydrolase
MNVKRFHVGWLSTNCYVVSCEETKQAAVIDPGLETKQEGEEILDYINKNGLQVKYIINTHGHSDHVSGNDFIKKATGAPILIHETASIAEVKADRKLREGDVIHIGKLTLTVLHTPGHTPDGISLVADNAVFTGDTLFAGSIGRSDFLGGSYHDLIVSIKSKLMALPDSFVVYPGHEAFSTIGNEREYNPFLQR